MGLCIALEGTATSELAPEGTGISAYCTWGVKVYLGSRNWQLWSWMGLSSCLPVGMKYTVLDALCACCLCPQRAQAMSVQL
jgi:hypothetical protein